MLFFSFLLCILKVEEYKDSKILKIEKHQRFLKLISFPKNIKLHNHFQKKKNHVLNNDF